MLKTFTCIHVFTDPLDFSVDEASHRTSHQNRSRRGRNRIAGNRSFSGNSSSSQHGHLNQDFKPPFRQDASNYVAYEHQHPHQGSAGARQGGRGRGRGRREGTRSVNGNFGGSISRQRPGGDFGRYNTNNQVDWASNADLPPRVGSSTNWRRNEENSLEQTSEQDSEAKKPRKFNQEHRRAHHYEKENNAKEGGPKSGDAEEDTHRVQTGKTGPDFQRGAKKRQGPIKPPKAPGTGSESMSKEQTELSWSRAPLDGASEVGHGSGRHTPQARGRRRTHQQNHRPGQGKWEKMPESKETQTGEMKPM